MKRGWFAAAATAAVLLSATPASADPFAGEVTASEAELATFRGGLLTAGGVTFDLGAIIRTYQNGELALETVLTWTPDGAAMSSTAAGPYAGAAEAAVAAAAQLAAGGFSVNDPAGGTRIVHGVDGASLRNLVVTSASDTAFAQDIQVTITLPGFESMQGGLALDRLGLRIGADLDRVLAAAGRF